MSAGKFIAGFIVGGAIGAVAGILLAPKSGEETRNEIANGAKEMLRKADETAKQIQSKTGLPAVLHRKNDDTSRRIS